MEQAVVGCKFMNTRNGAGRLAVVGCKFMSTRRCKFMNTRNGGRGPQAG